MTRGKARFVAQYIIACQNGLLHLPTWALMPKTPLFYSHNAFDFNCDADVLDTIFPFPYIPLDRQLRAKM